MGAELNWIGLEMVRAAPRVGFADYPTDEYEGVRRARVKSALPVSYLDHTKPPLFPNALGCLLSFIYYPATY